MLIGTLSFATTVNDSEVMKIANTVEDTLPSEVKIENQEMKGCPVVRVNYSCCYEYVEMCSAPSWEYLMLMEEVNCGDQ